MAALVMKAWPQTRGAQWLQRTLIDEPLALLSRFRRAHLILAVVAFAMMIAFAEMGMPHLAMAAAVDVSAYVDAMITIWTVAALTRARGGWTALRARMPRLPLAARARPRRKRRPRPALRAPANDDEGSAQIVCAA